MRHRLIRVFADLAPALLLVEEIVYYVWSGSPAMVFSSCMPPCTERLSAKTSNSSRYAVSIFHTWTEASSSSFQMPLQLCFGEIFANVMQHTTTFR